MAENDELKIKIMAYLDVFGSENGKIVLDDLKQVSGYERYSRPKKGHDGHTDIFDEIFDKGCQYMVARIIVFMNKDPNEKKGIRNE